MTAPLEVVSGGRSFLSWVGGKSQLAGTIVPRIPPHTCYCEVFAGAAWLLFKKSTSKVEVINDINVDLITLYRVVKHHLDEFVRYLRWVLVAREEFDKFLAAEPDTLTDVQRAVRFYYLAKVGFGARLPHPNFGYSTTAAPRLNLLRVEEDLSAAHLRLSRVYIERLPYLDLIDRYDRAHTFFYVDPPYFGCEDYYGKGVFERADFERLAERLARAKGRFILSINDVPEIRAIFAAFRIDQVGTSYSVGKAKRSQRVTELLVSNFG